MIKVNLSFCSLKSTWPLTLNFHPPLSSFSIVSDFSVVKLKFLHGINWWFSKKDENKSLYDIELNNNNQIWCTLSSGLPTLCIIIDPWQILSSFNNQHIWFYCSRSNQKLFTLQIQNFSPFLVLTLYKNHRRDKRPLLSFK